MTDKIKKKKSFKIKLLPYIFAASSFGFYFCLTKIIRMSWGGWAESCFNFFILSISSGLLLWRIKNDNN